MTVPLPFWDVDNLWITTTWVLQVYASVWALCEHCCEKAFPQLPDNKAKGQVQGQRLLKGYLICHARVVDFMEIPLFWQLAGKSRSNLSNRRDKTPIPPPEEGPAAHSEFWPGAEGTSALNSASHSFVEVGILACFECYVLASREVFRAASPEAST